jgi:phage baseplate assembly protein gpV
MRREAQRTQSGRATMRMGIVSSYNPQTYQAKVRLQPENAMTDWLPVSTIWIGNNWGLFCPVSPNDQVMVEFEQDDINSGVITKRLFDVNTNQPLSVESGEFWIIHKGGSYVKLTNDNILFLHGQAKIEATSDTIDITADNDLNEKATTINITGSQNVIIKAPAITGSNGGDAQQVFLKAFQQLYNSHTHAGVQSGGSVTGPPVVPSGEESLTQIVTLE